MPATPILQFGTSRFLQAHADLFISEAIESSDALGHVAVVQSSGDPSRRRRLHALAAPEGFPVRIEGIEDGETVRRDVVVTSIKRALDTNDDWEEITSIAVEEAEAIISNTGDAGWAERVEDLSPTFMQNMSYPAKLTQLLRSRFMAGRGGLCVLPAELVPRNGDRLRQRVFDIAAGLDAELLKWIAAEVVFANSLVDRIVSEPLEPAGAVAEPYALWAIEEQQGLVLPCRHAAIQVVPSLERIEKLKLHILNLGHTYMAGKWIASSRSGEPLVRELLADPAMRADLLELYEQEVLPAFVAAGWGDEAEAYIRTTVDRFANPFLAHKLSDIAQNHGEKTRRRIGSFLDWGKSLGLRLPQPKLSNASVGAE